MKTQSTLMCALKQSQLMQVRQVTHLETYPVRHPVLRAGRPLESCAMPGDEDKTTLHLGLFDQDKLVGVASFMKASHLRFSGNQYQLRGMGLLPSHQGEKKGHLLIQEGEKHLRNKEVDLLWCNARIKALNFYLRNDFTRIGEPFEIDPIGSHYLLFKNLHETT